MDIPQTGTRRPNVLLIITDQQRADHVGFAGNSMVRTPNLDAIAGEGVIFDNAWVANPVCMPNRSTIMTGRMPSAHGVIFNDRSLEWGAATFVRTFRAAGWRTGLLGKSHLQHGMSRNSVVAQPLAPVASDPWPEGWSGYEDQERYFDTWPDDPDDFYGFDRIRLAIDHGGRASGHHLLWALDKGGRREDLLVPYSDESPAKIRSSRWWQVYQPPYGPELHSTSFVCEQTIEFIREASGEGKPWLAVASFPDPHHPFTPPGDYYNRYKRSDVELPSTLDDPLDRAPNHVKRLRKVTPQRMRSWVGMTGYGDDPELVRECIAANYGTIEMIDDAVGSIMQTIRELGHDDNTIVVFTSDHGDMMGEHGFLLKGYLPFSGIQRVPLVIRAPGVEPGRSGSLASSLDIAQTLLDCAGLPEHFGMQGASLAPVMHDLSVEVRDHLVIENDYPTAAGGQAAFLPTKDRTLVTSDGHKYVRLSTAEDMLFDLNEDRTEVHELGAARPELRAQMLERMTDALIQLSDDARGTPVG